MSNDVADEKVDVSPKVLLAGTCTTNLLVATSCKKKNGGRGGGDGGGQTAMFPTVCVAATILHSRGVVVG